jgi:hypothetical protein
MSTSQIRRLVPGDEVGYYTVIALLEDARSHANRLYQARMGCCGRVVEITQKRLIDSRRYGALSCQPCAARARLTKRGAPVHGLAVTIGESIGPVTVIAAGADSRHKIVRWHCCNKEEEVRHAKLHRLRSDHKHGQTHEQCWSCYTKGRYANRPVPPPALILPPGILSAATAWPRPRVGV